MIELLETVNLTQIVIILILLVIALKEAIGVYEFFKSHSNDYYNERKFKETEKEAIINKLNCLEKKIDGQNKKIEEVEEYLKVSKQTNVDILYDRINQKCRYYINDLNGIPEDEYEGFKRLFNSYERNNGNHGLADKVNYCFEHLDIIPSRN